LVACDRLVVGLQVLAQAGIVVEPPAAGRRHREVLRAGLAQRLKLGDRLLGVRRVVPGPSPVLGLGEMQRAVSAEAEQGVVAAARGGLRGEASPRLPTSPVAPGGPTPPIAACSCWVERS